MRYELETVGWRSRLIVIDDERTIYPSHRVSGPKPEQIVEMHWLGPKGGFGDYLLLTCEDAWILGSMLVDVAEHSA